MTISFHERISVFVHFSLDFFRQKGYNQINRASTYSVITFQEVLNMKNIFKNKDFWLVVAGAAGAVVGKKVIPAKKTRELAVKGLAKGMKFTDDAKTAFRNMKDEAQDICYEAKEQAGLNEESEN